MQSYNIFLPKSSKSGIIFYFGLIYLIFRTFYFWGLQNVLISVFWKEWYHTGKNDGMDTEYRIQFSGELQIGWKRGYLLYIYIISKIFTPIFRSEVIPSPTKLYSVFCIHFQKIWGFVLWFEKRVLTLWHLYL